MIYERSEEARKRRIKTEAARALPGDREAPRPKAEPWPRKRRGPAAANPHRAIRARAGVRGIPLRLDEHYARSSGCPKDAGE